MDNETLAALIATSQQPQRSKLADFLRSEKDTRPFANTIGQRAMLMPVAKSGYNNSDVTAMPGLLHDAMQAVTLPKRVYDGDVAPNDVGENLNFTMNMIGGGTAFGRPAGSLGSGGIRAYHGSPHDFDKFDLSKIGTGEGAQAYGHGLYFAESEGVAKAYRDQLSDYNWKDPIDAATGYLTQLNGDRAAAAAAAKSQADTPALKRAAEILASDADVQTRTPGRMYEVSIKSDPSDFLDWDKPLSQQSEKVRQALEKINPEAIASDAARWYPHDIVQAPTAEQLKQLQTSPDRYETQAIRNAGIPGIKYLDQGSRGAGEGSRNYVVFDDKLVEILRKYGLLGTLAGTGAVAGNGGQE